MEKEIREAIEAILLKNKKIIIYPFGFYGKKVKEILNTEFGVEEFAIIDNNCADNNVWKIGDINVDKANEYCYLVACMGDVNFTEIIKTLDELKVDSNNIEDVFWEKHYYHLYAPNFMIYDAERHGLTLAQYYENHYNRLGVKTDTVIEKIASVIDIPQEGSICEIGTGSGRFLVKLIERFRPAKYEFYEIEKILAEYIVQNYHYQYCQIIDDEASGDDLGKTESESQDLVFVSNVFSLIKYSITYQYFLEMIRVCKTGGVYSI